jgi:hypothetical protein
MKTISGLLICLVIFTISPSSVSSGKGSQIDSKSVGSCVAAPSSNFMFLPFDVDPVIEGDWLTLMSSAFDHDFPNYSCLYPGSGCDEENRKIIIWNGDEARPITLYNPNNPEEVLGKYCYLPGSSRTLRTCSQSILGYQSVTDETSAVYYDGHNGFDLRLSSGANGKVLASASGIVEDVTANVSPYGISIVIDHLKGYKTVYSHLQSGSIQVSEGDCVTEGQYIARQGNTVGDYKPHLHFRVFHSDVSSNLNITDPFGYCYECGGYPTDPLQSYTGESSINLWYGIYTRSVGKTPSRLTCMIHRKFIL